MVSLLLWLLVGGLIGAFTMRKHGKAIDILIGAYGALIGGFFMNLLISEGVTGFNIMSFIVALCSAATFIWMRKNIFEEVKQ